MKIVEGLPALPLTAVVRGAGVRWEQSGIHMRSYAGQSVSLSESLDLSRRPLVSPSFSGTYASSSARQQLT